MNTPGTEKAVCSRQNATVQLPILLEHLPEIGCEWRDHFSACLQPASSEKNHRARLEVTGAGRFRGFLLELGVKQRAARLQHLYLLLQ